MSETFVMTDDAADYALLSLANEKGKFAIALIGSFPEPVARAFDRGVEGGWFALVDVAPLHAAHGTICRVFKLTDRGFYRLRCVTPTAGGDAQ